jgi:hypothetical protein
MLKKNHCINFKNFYESFKKRIVMQFDYYLAVFNLYVGGLCCYLKIKYMHV